MTRHSLNDFQAVAFLVYQWVHQCSGKSSIESKFFTVHHRNFCEKKLINRQTLKKREEIKVAKNNIFFRLGLFLRLIFFSRQFYETTPSFEIQVYAGGNTNCRTATDLVITSVLSYGFAKGPGWEERGVVRPTKERKICEIVAACYFS